MQFTPVHTNVMYAMHAVTRMHTTTPLCTSLQINYSVTYVDNFRAYIYLHLHACPCTYVCMYTYYIKHSLGSLSDMNNSTSCFSIQLQRIGQLFIKRALVTIGCVVY